MAPVGIVAAVSHEHHLEKEQGKDTHLKGRAAQKETLEAEQSEGLAEQGKRELPIQQRGVSQRGNGTNATHLQGIAAHPIAKDANGINHEIHRHRVGNVLGAREAAFHHGKSRLHEHHQEAGQKNPHQIYCCSVADDQGNQILISFSRLRDASIVGRALLPRQRRLRPQVFVAHSLGRSERTAGSLRQAVPQSSNILRGAFFVHPIP